jgi:uncharacterized protein YndB with AHSA1/START domain
MAATADVTTPSDLDIRVTRVFEAPARVVFDYHTKPEHVQKWLLGPPGWSMPVCEIDLRVGGRYHYEWRNDETGHRFGIRGEYLEIEAPARLVHRERMDGADGDVLCTTTFVQTGARTTLTITIRFGSKDARDGALQSGMTGGMSISYDRLDETLHETEQREDVSVR